MAIEATYALNNYLLTPIQAIDSAVTFYPGNSAPESLGKAFILYNTIPNNPFELFMINADIVRYKVIHTDYEKVQKIAGVILNELNVYQIQGSFTGTTDDNKAVTPLHTFASSTTPGNAYFPDGVEYYFINMSVTYTYKLI